MVDKPTVSDATQKTAAPVAGHEASNRMLDEVSSRPPAAKPAEKQNEKPNEPTAKPNEVAGKPNEVAGKPNEVAGKPNEVAAKPNETAADAKPAQHQGWGDWIKSGASGAAGTMLHGFEIVADGAKTVTNKVEQGAGNLVNKVEQGAGNLVDKVEQGAGNLVNKVEQGAGNLLNKAETGVKSALNSDAAHYVEQKAENVADIGKTLVVGAGESVWHSAKEIGNTAVAIKDGAVNGAGKTVEWVKEHPYEAIAVGTAVVAVAATGGLAAAPLAAGLASMGAIAGGGIAAVGGSVAGVVEVAGVAVAGMQAIKTAANVYEHGDVGTLWNQENHTKGENDKARTGLKADTGEALVTIGTSLATAGGAALYSKVMGAGARAAEGVVAVGAEKVAGGAEKAIPPKPGEAAVDAVKGVEEVAAGTGAHETAQFLSGLLARVNAIKAHELSEVKEGAQALNEGRKEITEVGKTGKELYEKVHSGADEKDGDHKMVSGQHRPHGA